MTRAIYKIDEEHATLTSSESEMRPRPRSDLRLSPRGMKRTESLAQPDNAVRPVSILLVEDNQDDVELMQMALESVDPTTLLVVRNGQEALDFLFREGPYTDRQGGMPDLVLLDLNMPRLGGLEVLRAIRGRSRRFNVPVIVLSASGRLEDVQAAYATGSNTYIKKPVSFVEFE